MTHEGNDSKLGSSDSKNFSLAGIVGLEKKGIPDSLGRKAFGIHQSADIALIVADFKTRLNHGKDLRTVPTPIWSKAEKASERNPGLAEEKLPERIPELRKNALELIGKLLWVTRGSRPDIMAATH